MRVYVVRHACAGRKEEWEGADSERPLDVVGREQAAALSELLKVRGVRRLLSSPTRRCIETLEPLAAASDMEIEAVHALASNASTETLLDLVTDPLNDDAVLCTHGEVMRPLLAWLRQSGVRIEPHDDDDHLLGKGTGWLVGVAGDEPRTLEHLAPAPWRECALHPAPRSQT